METCAEPAADSGAHRGNPAVSEKISGKGASNTAPFTALAKVLKIRPSFPLQNIVPAVAGKHYPRMLGNGAQNLACEAQKNLGCGFRRGRFRALVGNGIWLQDDLWQAKIPRRKFCEPGLGVVHKRTPTYGEGFQVLRGCRGGGKFC